MPPKDPKSWVILIGTALASALATGYTGPKVAPQFFTPAIPATPPLSDYRLTLLETSLVGIRQDIANLREDIDKLPPERLIDRIHNLEVKVEVLINQMDLKIK